MNLNDLNPSQLAAVTYNEGPSLVIAGAGSGKTRVLTYKIAYLLEKGVRAGNILALTFTNKAAREMKNRIGSLVGEANARYLWMGTFHSIAARLLRQDAEKLGFTNDYTIYDTEDSNRVIKEIIRALNLNDKQYKHSVVRSRISMAKNHLVGPHAYASSEWVRDDAKNRLPQIYQIYHLYWQRLNESNAMDFDDLLVNLYRLLETNPDVCQKWQSLFQYILVDEYQDTNYVQYMLVKRLAEPQNLVCVVGDDAQSIYSFRGANIGNILSFQKEYINARLFKLERNYRSTQSIVKAANSLIDWNKEQIRKNIYSEKEEGNHISVSCHLTDRDEAEWVINQILLLRRREKRDWLEFVVLYRTNAQSRVFEDACRKYQIPYRLYGSVSFYQRKEIKDALAYIRLSLNEKDNDAFQRIINVPARGIGETSQKKIVQTALDAKVSLLTVANQPGDYAVPVSVATKKKLQDFAQLIASFANESEQMTAYDYVKKVLNASGIMASALADTTPEGQDRYQNLQELLSSIHEAEDAHLNETGEQLKIREFMASVALITDQDQQANDQKPHISLMTVHTAKGLEYPVVFVAGLEENLFPSSMAFTQRDIEEERRLLYVAITRAEELCFLTYARQRFRNGQVTCQNASRFIEEISDKYLERSDKQAKKTTWGQSISSYMESRPQEKPTYKRLGVRKPDNETAQDNIDSVNTEYPIGCRVQHRIFGKGTVLRTYRDNGNEKIDIQFDLAGKKTLLLQFAKLTKA